METFEFLSVLQIHGFPRMLGVATHMDYLKENKQKKKMKKELRKRFEIEVPPESKLFFVKNLKKGLYDFKDIHNLSRFLSVIIPRQMDFKKQHPHILVDRVEKSEGRSMVFGYVRGADLIQDQNQKQFLVSGLGMVNFSEVKKVHDPCPVGVSGQKRGLRKNDKKLYAPQCNIGMALFDDTGDYVEIPDKHVVFTQKEGQTQEIQDHQGVKMMRNLQIGGDQESSEEEFELIDGVGVQQEESNKIEEEIQEDNIGELAMKVHQEYKEDQGKILKMEDSQVIDLNRIVYPGLFSQKQEADKISDFSANKSSYLHKSANGKPKQSSYQTDFLKIILEKCGDSSYFYPTHVKDIEFYSQHTKCRFATGFKGDESDPENSEDEMEEDSSVDLDDYESDEDAGLVKKEKEIDQLKTVNSNLIPKGSYIRIELANIPEKIFKKFTDMPVIVSQLATGETQMGFLMVKFKRHRFYRNLLKTNDPLIVSLNFSKYQTVPYFCRKDLGQRLRMLKYTPKHEFCMAVFYGNYVPSQTGVIAFQTISKISKKINFFRRKRNKI